MDECKALDAQLPLPKSKGEADAFRKITGTDNTWMGIRDLTKSKTQSQWKDAEGNPINSAYVNLRVMKLVFNFRFL